MKKSILAFSFILSVSAGLMLSCKKKKDDTSFTQTDVTGTTVVKGNVNKNVISHNGNGNWTNTNRVNMAGVTVTIKINKGGSQGLYPNSPSSSGASVYSGVTDASGNYAITVKANANGVSAQITIDGFTGTQDTVINGVTKTGLYAIYAGMNTTRTLYMGQTVTVDHNFTATNVSSNPNNFITGMATITGSINMNMIRKNITGTVIALSTTNVAVPANTTVYLSFDKDPALLTSKVYQTTTDAAGRYTFTVTTVPVNTPGFNQDATIWVADYAATRDTLNYNGANNTFLNTTPGPLGVFRSNPTFQSGVYSTDIRNATHLTYSMFTPN